MTQLIPEGKPLVEMYVSDLHGALQMAAAADCLDLGWRIDGYDCTKDGFDEQREHRILVWRKVLADRGPYSATAERGDLNVRVKHEDDESSDA